MQKLKEEIAFWCVVLSGIGGIAAVLQLFGVKLGGLVAMPPQVGLLVVSILLYLVTLAGVIWFRRSARSARARSESFQRKAEENYGLYLEQVEEVKSLRIRERELITNLEKDHKVTLEKLQSEHVADIVRMRKKQEADWEAARIRPKIQVQHLEQIKRAGEAELLAWDAQQITAQLREI
jgi:hypothetical protein